MLTGLKTVKLVHPRLKWAKNELDWSKNMQNLIFSAHFGFFWSNKIFIGSAAYRFQEESEPVILNSFFCGIL